MSVLEELLLKKDLSYEALFYKYDEEASKPYRHVLNKKKLSSEALRVVNGAYRHLTGMELHVNRYWLAESMTEAICAAEALNL